MQAKVASLKTNVWTVEGKPLTGAELEQVWLALPDARKVSAILHDVSGSRRWDRALQLLKKWEMVSYDKVSRKWIPVGRDLPVSRPELKEWIQINKYVREQTRASLKESTQALEINNYDVKKAIAYIRELHPVLP